MSASLVSNSLAAPLRQAVGPGQRLIAAAAGLVRAVGAHRADGWGDQVWHPDHEREWLERLQRTRAGIDVWR